MEHPSRRVKCRQDLINFFDGGGCVVVQSRCVLHDERFMMKTKDTDIILNTSVGIIDEEGNVIYADIYCEDFCICILSHINDQPLNCDFKVQLSEYSGRIVSIKATDINTAFDVGKIKVGRISKGSSSLPSSPRSSVSLPKFVVVASSAPPSPTHENSTLPPITPRKSLPRTSSDPVMIAPRKNQSLPNKVEIVPAVRVNLNEKSPRESIKTIIFADRNTKRCNLCSIQIPNMCNRTLARHLGIMTEAKPYDTIHLQWVDEASMGKYIKTRYKWTLDQSTSSSRLNNKNIKPTKEQFIPLDTRLWKEVISRKKCIICECIYPDVCILDPYCPDCRYKFEDDCSYNEDIWTESTSREELKNKLKWLDGLTNFGCAYCKGQGLCMKCFGQPKCEICNQAQNYFVNWNGVPKACCHKCLGEKCSGGLMSFLNIFK